MIGAKGLNDMHAIEWITFKRYYALPTPTGSGTPVLFVAGDAVRVQYSNKESATCKCDALTGAVFSSCAAELINQNIAGYVGEGEHPSD